MSFIKTEFERIASLSLWMTEDLRVETGAYLH